MSDTIRRINPRRPFIVTAEGFKRIVLGEAGAASSVHVAAHREAAAKPLRLAGEPRGHILVIAHSDRGALDAHAHETIAAAALLADAATAVSVLVLGELNGDLAAAGADRVYAANGCDKGSFDPARELALVTRMVTALEPQHVILPDNGIGDGDLGRRLAARLGVSVATQVVELNAGGVASYWHGGAQMARRALPRILMLAAGTTDPALPFRGAGKVEPVEALASADNRYADLGMPPVEARQLGLEEADFIVAAGNGVSDVPKVLALAERFGAAVGASRVAVDDGRFSRDKQVGATGKTVNASVYVAIGISGAVQHLQGIKAVRHVIAVNNDASAPIAGRADLTVVGDAQEVMDALLEATRGRNASGDEASVDSLSLRGGEARVGGSLAPIQHGGSEHPHPSSPVEGEEPHPVSRSAPRVLVLASLGRNPVSGVARANRDDVLALELGRGLGGVTLLHAGDAGQEALADYLAYGARSVDVVAAPAGTDLASVLADRARGHDLILTGTRAEGGEGSGLVLYLVAEKLGWPVVTQALDVAIADGHAEVVQALPKGQRRRVRVRLPAVIAVDPRAPAKPRYAHARRMAGRIVSHENAAAAPADDAWRVETAGKRPVKFKARESKAGHARMLSAIVAESKGGALVDTGTPADKAQAILSYLRTHKLIDW